MKSAVCAQTGIAMRLLPFTLATLLTGCQPADRTADSTPPAARPTSSSAQTAPAPRSVVATTSHWQCGDLRVSTRFEDASLDAVTVRFSGRRLLLKAVPTGDGAHFADAAGNEFRSRPGDVRFTLAGKPPVSCSKSPQASPWVEAELRGMAWRAAGNEPGWFAEVSADPAAALDATLDYGERRIVVPRTEKLSGKQTGFRGATADGTTVRLSIERTPCADGMSGEEFEATATLRVGDKTYRGCAAFLGD